MAYVLTSVDNSADGFANGERYFTAQVDNQAGLSDIEWLPKGSKAIDNGGVVFLKCPSTGHWVLPDATPILILEQPADAATKQGTVSGTLSVVCYAQDKEKEYAPTYQWKTNTSASIDGASDVDGATTATLTIPTSITAGDVYYYCVITANSKTLNTRFAKVVVAAA